MFRKRENNELAYFSAILLLVLMLVIVSFSPVKAQYAPSYSSREGDFHSYQFFAKKYQGLAATVAANGASETIPIPVMNNTKLTLQVFKGHIGASTAAFTGAVSGIKYWLEGKPVINAATTSVSWVTYPICDAGSTTFSATAWDTYGLRNADLYGLAYVRVRWTGNSDDNTIVIGVK